MKKEKQENGSQSSEGTKQKGLFKKTRGGVELTKEQVKQIKEGRKKLRKQMKKKKIRSRKEFELTASSMGLYFDKYRGTGLLLWLLHGRALWALLGAAAALLAVMFLFSLVSQLRGHFTINLSDGMFRNGFSLSEEKSFENPIYHLYSEPVENVPCISISSIPEDVDELDGSHNGDDYFAYSFYLKYNGEDGDPCDYTYDVKINSEAQVLSKATWLMLFVDGKMSFYAKAREDGTTETLPSAEFHDRGYRVAPFKDVAASQSQFEVVGSRGGNTYYRLLPVDFVDEKSMAQGLMEKVQPGDIHKYTVVLWLEGDDPDCNDELIGGSLGLEINFALAKEDEQKKAEEENPGFLTTLKRLWDTMKESLTFWEG